METSGKSKMIKAVFFDWFYTIARPDPERHEIYCQVLPEFGIEPSAEKLIRGLYDAENQVPKGSPYKWSESEEVEPYIRYLDIVLSEVGVKLSRDTVLEVLKKVSPIARKVTYVLYDDVIPTLKTLKGQGLVLGLITSIGKEVNLVCSELGLDPYLNFVVSAKEVGADKPQPPIFMAALERAGVSASQAVYVGDQYEADVVGARGVGIKPILIDRWDLLTEVNDCARIHTLSEALEHI